MVFDILGHNVIKLWTNIDSSLIRAIRAVSCQSSLGKARGRAEYHYYEPMISPNIESRQHQLAGLGK